MNNFSWDSLGTITSRFGKRDTGIPGASTDHKGMDIVLSNPNIPAIVGGTVIDKGTSPAAGNYIKIAQTDGKTATYMHMKNLSPLKVGTVVDVGEVVGVQGSTGISSGDHLHYQIQDAAGNFIDPMTYENGGFSGTTGNFYSTDKLSTKEKLLEIVGTVLKFITLVFVGIIAGYLFFKAFDIKII